MDKETINKVLEVLSKHGIDKEVLDEVETDLTVDTPKEEEPVVDELLKEEVKEQPTDAVPPVEEETKTEEAKEETDKDNAEPPVDDTVPPVEEEQATNPLPEGVEEINVADEGVVPPTEEPVAPIQPVEPEFDYRKAYEEANETIKGLTSRIDSLEEALKKGGFIEETTKTEKEVGVDDPTNLGGGQSDETLMDDVLADLNRKY